MSSPRRGFQCFNTVGAEGCKSSLPLKAHRSCFPRIAQHGILAHHEPVEECYCCSEYRRAQVLEALDAHTTLFCHSHLPCIHHHPQQYLPRRPEELPAVRSGQGHHHRNNRRVVLVKNSDPSFRRAIFLHHQSVQSFGLFLEEISELMQYNVRKVYSLEGHKVGSSRSAYLPRHLNEMERSRWALNTAVIHV